MLSRTAVILALAMFVALVAPVLTAGPADAAGQCSRVYTSSGWITRC